MSHKILGPVTNILLCEDVRQEPYGKASYLGVYGFLDDVDILIKELGKPVNKITFVVHTAKSLGTGIIKLQGKIIEPQGSVYLEFPDLEYKVAKKGRGLRIIIGVEKPVFKMAGQYRIKLEMESEEIASGVFNIQEKPDL